MKNWRPQGLLVSDYSWKACAQHLVRLVGFFHYLQDGDTTKALEMMTHSERWVSRLSALREILSISQKEHGVDVEAILRLGEIPAVLSYSAEVDTIYRDEFVEDLARLL